MDVEKIKKELDFLSESYNKLELFRSESFTICSPFSGVGVHIYDGIEKIAEAIGVELVRTKRNDKHNLWLSFVYNDVIFFEIREEEVRC